MYKLGLYLFFAKVTTTSNDSILLSKLITEFEKYAGNKITIKNETNSSFLIDIRIKLTSFQRNDLPASSTGNDKPEDAIPESYMSLFQAL